MHVIQGHCADFFRLVRRQHQLESSRCNLQGEAHNFGQRNAVLRHPIHEISEFTNSLTHTDTYMDRHMQNTSIYIIYIALNELNAYQFLDYFQIAITFWRVWTSVSCSLCLVKVQENHLSSYLSSLCISHSPTLTCRVPTLYTLPGLGLCELSPGVQFEFYTKHRCV